ncbi:uncharacterized protein LOC129317535 [Prosopis cineraria]|uniref:uncharacterized protein LOC129317535 n=1 Tax=Prosopis cineraria TaxID=364024 RepID=UPI0024109DCE|nr:uncharacterized protein LOC129317535 [Prosopis cineraria]
MNSLYKNMYDGLGNKVESMGNKCENMNSKIDALTSQMNMLANQLSAANAQASTLPSNTVANPKANLNAITLRSGKELGERVQEDKRQGKAEKPSLNSSIDVNVSSSSFAPNDASFCRDDEDENIEEIICEQPPSKVKKGTMAELFSKEKEGEAEQSETRKESSRKEEGKQSQEIMKKLPFPQAQVVPKQVKGQFDQEVACDLCINWAIEELAQLEEANMQGLQEIEDKSQEGENLEDLKHEEIEV